MSLSGRAELPGRLPVGPLLQDGEGGDGDDGERQQAAPSERAAAPRRLLLHWQKYPQPGIKYPSSASVVLWLAMPA